jgi:hypothetical protein
MDLISLGIFIATFSLVGLMFVIDLAKYKFHLFFAIIVLGVALYSYGMSFNGETLNAIDTVLKAFGNTTAILRGIFRTSDISNRINNDLLFLLSAYAIHVIGFGYTYLLVFAIFFQNLGLKMRFYFHKKRPHLVVLGDDEKLNYLLEAYQQSSSNKHKTEFKRLKKVNIAVSKTYLATKELKYKYAFKPGVTSFDPINQELDMITEDSPHDHMLISLLSQPEDILALVEKLNQFYKEHPQSKLQSYVLYDDKNQLPVFESFNQEKHKLKFFSYHQLVAQQLMLEHPLTRFIPFDMIDQERVTLKEVNIKYHLLGFGPTNQAIYDHLFVTNQFPPMTSTFFGKMIGTLNKQPLQYIVYQDAARLHQAHPFIPSPTPQKDYLPLPPLSSSTKNISTDFNHGKFVDSLKKEVSVKDDYHVLIIAFGDDVKNLSVLQQALDMIVEKRLTNYRVFVQMIHQDYSRSSHLFSNPNVLPFGSGLVGYAVEQISNPVFNNIASQIQNTLNPNVPFESLTSEEKESLLYEAISLRFKLNLMGLDLAEQQKGLTEANFFKKYDPGEDARFHQTHPRAKNDADLNRYKPTIRKKRNLLARQEHLRWTAYQAMRGIIPMSLTEMQQAQHYRDISLKKDGRMTSFEGLFELHHFLIHHLNYEFSKADFIYPSFHTMDHLYQILKGTPYRIVDKVDEKNNQTLEINTMQASAVESKIQE